MSFVRYNNSDYAPLQNDSQDMVDPNIELHELAANTLASSLVWESNDVCTSMQDPSDQGDSLDLPDFDTLHQDWWGFTVWFRSAAICQFCFRREDVPEEVSLMGKVCILHVYTLHTACYFSGRCRMTTANINRRPVPWRLSSHSYRLSKSSYLCSDLFEFSSLDLDNYWGHSFSRSPAAVHCKLISITVLPYSGMPQGCCRWLADWHVRNEGNQWSDSMIY